MHRIAPLFALLSIFVATANLSAQVVPSPVPDGRFRVATWNIRFFPQPTTDVSRVVEIIADLDADLIAVQEITSATDLQNLLNQVNVESARRSVVYGTRLRNYDSRLTQSGGSGGQFVGLIFDTNAVQLSNVADVPRLRMSSGLRPGLFARVTSLRGGIDFQIIANHTDSGTGLTDYEHRQEFFDSLAVELEERWEDDADFIVIGDLNTMGRSASGNERRIRSEEEITILDQAAWDMGLRRISGSPPCTEYFEGNGGLLDHILATIGMREVPANAVAGIHGYCALVACRPQDQNNMPSDFTTVSDHCPVVLDLIDVDWD